MNNLRSLHDKSFFNKTNLKFGRDNKKKNLFNSKFFMSFVSVYNTGSNDSFFIFVAFKNMEFSLSSAMKIDSGFSEPNACYKNMY